MIVTQDSSAAAAAAAGVDADAIKLTSDVYAA